MRHRHCAVLKKYQNRTADRIVAPAQAGLVRCLASSVPASSIYTPSNKYPHGPSTSMFSTLS